MRTVRVLVVLDTMWGSRGRAPQWFFINPRNRSGARLYKLTGTRFGELAVTNACPQAVSHATAHGTPSPAWLLTCLQAAPAPRALLLVCGVRARAAYAACGHRHEGPTLHLKHPAARTWTKRELARVARKIRTLL